MDQGLPWRVWQAWLRARRHYVVESRFANGERERRKELVAELLGTKVDVFLIAGEPVLLAAKQHGGNIPIVTVSCDPSERLLGSLARPGGNATGFTCISSDLGSKRMGVVKALLPASERIAILYREMDTLKTELEQVGSQADQLGSKLAQFPVQSPEDFGPAFKQMIDQKSDALYIVPSSFANFHHGVGLDNSGAGPTLCRTAILVGREFRSEQPN